MKLTACTALLAISVAGCASQGAPGPTASMYDQRVAIPPQQQAVAPHSHETGDSASLWATTSSSLLSMRRATEVGDLLTVIVEMNDQADLQNSLTRSRSSSEDTSVNALLGLPEWANGVLPGGASLSPGVDMERNSNLNGSGAVRRAEKVTFTLACRVVGIEPNGNLIIEGYQQTRVSNEVRYLTVSGVIRSQDITRTNTVSYEKIADANLAYVSKGEATGRIQRGTVPKVLDKVLPF